MYDYDEVYEKIIKNTESVNLSAEESIKIIDKIYNDLEIGILKPRNINKRCLKLICNSLSRQTNQKEELNIEQYKINSFIENVLPKLKITDEEIKGLEKKLLSLDEINSQTLDFALKKYLDEIGNDSLKMIRNQDFRKFDQAIVTLEDPDFAQKYGIYDREILLYSFIDHEEGILFELLSDENHENPILTKRDLDDEIIKHIDRECLEDDEYAEIRNLRFLDKFRDQNNPDIVTVKFIKSGKSEHLKVRLESIVGSKIIGTLVENAEKIDGLSVGIEVVVSYCYDFTDEIHVYSNCDLGQLAWKIREISTDFNNPSKDVIVEKLSVYKDNLEFDFIVDTFHSIIFDHFRDLNEFYNEIDKEVIECI
ncbi:MAG: hypothetical protein Q4P18_08025 [Methanobrevibacter sp.]|uniref:hypothetical protein n=1 Tax=Methanobrevibacter sp. TaxID=66852 RepID=UPI0026DF7E0A|nr:hypothetical protein [Methanobrevibacter sp.]MDO5849468.1 hypothetical protein [Methanobrevibacter sp.]